MPKGKKKGKKKNGKKGKKYNGKIPLTPKEEIIQYQINVKRETLDKLKFEYEEISKDNKKHKEKLKRHKLDLEKFSTEMIRKYRESLKENKDKSIILDKSDVISTMKTNWKIKKIEIKDILKLEEEIRMKDTEIRSLEDEIKSLIFLRDEEIKNNEMQILALNQFLDDMKNNFSAISSYTQKNHDARMAELTDEKTSSIEELQRKACIKASKVINDDAKHEISDNQWLKNKASIHRINLEKLKREIENIQMVNIELNKQLFELNHDNSTFQSFYLTDIEPDDILFQNGILEYDVEDVIKSNISKNENIKVISTTENDFYNSKDYLNFNSQPQVDLILAGKSISLQKHPPKSEAELMSDMHTLQSNPITHEMLLKLKSDNNLASQ